MLDPLQFGGVAVRGPQFETYCTQSEKTLPSALVDSSVQQGVNVTIILSLEIPLVVSDPIRFDIQFQNQFWWLSAQSVTPLFHVSSISSQEPCKY